MDEKERLEAIEVALNNEMGEREFYLKNAERTSNPLGKAMFKQIADEELEHYERLKELQKKWQASEKWPETVPLRVKDTAIKDVMKDVLAKIDEKARGDDDDITAIKTAIDFEAKGASFYAKLRDGVSDDKEKEFFNLLANIEHEHYMSLKETEEFFTNPAAWYTKAEHHGLDGA
jgi:rubrerythrin